MRLSWVVSCVVSVLSVSSSFAVEVVSTHETVPTTVTVDASSVRVFLDLAPRAWSVEREEMRALERIHRAHHRRRAVRLGVDLQDIEREFADQYGISFEEFIRLRCAITEVHRRLTVILQLQRERVDLLAEWNDQIRKRTAADEEFVRARECLEQELEEAQSRYKELPEMARVSVESCAIEIDQALRPPRKMSRAERRERAERAAEFLPPPPANPYR